jgi:hypothetical protein
LTEKEVLDEFVGLGPDGDLILQRRLLRGGEGADLRRPFPPGAAGKMILERREESVAGEPGAVLPAKGGETAIRQWHGRIPPPSGVRGEQQGAFHLIECAKINVIGIQRLERQQRVTIEQARANECGRIDQVGIARERRETLVGRIPVTGRSERAELPIFHSCLGEERDERFRGLVEGADTEGTRQGSRMEQNAGSAVIEPAEERGR